MNGENELPEGWTTAILKDITIDVKNVKPENEPNRVFEYVDISSINNQTYTIEEVKSFFGKDAPSRARRPIKKDDILFSNVRTYLRNISIVPEKYDNQLCSTGFTVLRPSSCILSKYLFYFVLTDSFIEQVSPQQRGSQYPATSDGVVKSVPILLPPLAEQRRIVAAVEPLLARVNASRERLDRVPGLLKAFRQAVLAAACSGRLTEAWREEHPDLENGSELLEKITKEKLINKIRSPKKLKITENLKTEKNSELPSKWVWTTIEQITLNFDGQRIPVKSDERRQRKGLFPYFGASGIIDTIDGFLFNGDFLLIGEDGANLVMRSTPIAFQAQGKFWVNNHAHVLKGLGGIPLSFLEYYINSIDLQPYTTGSAQPKLTQANMNQIPIPLPPLLEQHEIVRRVEALFALADRIEQRMAAGKERADRLTQAILAKAFRGELVPTEAELARMEGRSYEPAGVLLERIKAERKNI